MKTDQSTLSIQVESLLDRYKKVRKQTEDIISPLSNEDCVVQPAVFVSPPKWHLGHTTWFFETFILRDHAQNYQLFNNDFSYVFNSYYESEGDRLLRVNRGLLTRPSLNKVIEYRHHVDENVADFLHGNELSVELCDLIELGIQHEQQHQELLCYDIKYILGHSPLMPAYFANTDAVTSLTEQTKRFLSIESGVYAIGHKEEGFSYDNELGNHRVFLEQFEIGTGLITNGEYLAFMNDKGYGNFNHWLAEGWDWINNNGINAPMYWHFKNGQWVNYTLSGVEPIDLNAPVTHISYYEADAFASWKGMRLPTEFEWEVAANQYGELKNGLFMESESFGPKAYGGFNFFGNVWEWTSSAYLPYPYFKKAPGAVGEYNGKFMVNQKVLRGGSCVTPANHVRPTYRNFFHPDMRWMFSGMRLVKQ